MAQHAQVMYHTSC